MSLTALLDTDCEILRATPSTGDTGEVSLTWNVVASTKCAVSRAKGGAVRGPAGETLRADFVAYFPPGTDVRPEVGGELPDRVRIDGSDYVCLIVDGGGRRTMPVRAVLAPVE
jgi:hypothetical protein